MRQHAAIWLAIHLPTVPHFSVSPKKLFLFNSGEKQEMETNRNVITSPRCLGCTSNPRACSAPGTGLYAPPLFLTDRFTLYSPKIPPKSPYILTATLISPNDCKGLTDKKCNRANIFRGANGLT